MMLKASLVNSLSVDSSHQPFYSKNL